MGWIITFIHPACITENSKKSVEWIKVPKVDMDGMQNTVVLLDNNNKMMGRVPYHNIALIIEDIGLDT